MPKVFISYSRVDLLMAEKLVNVLVEFDVKPWIDLNGIPMGEILAEEIRLGIEESDIFLYLLSPDSAKSEWCSLEIAHALKNGKRILPIFIRETDHKLIHPEILNRKWIPCSNMPEGFEKCIETLLQVIKTDYEWVKYHTDLQNKALAWEKQKDNSRLLRGKELHEASKRLQQKQKDPLPTLLQQSYIASSSKQERLIKRILFGGVLFATLLLLFLATLMWRQRERIALEIATSQANEQKAVVQEKIANANELAIQSLDIRGSQFDISLLLAVEAMIRNDTIQTRSVLLNTTQFNSHLLRYLRGETDSINSVAISPDGLMLASVNTDGTITFWDLTTFQPIGTPLPGHSRLVSSVAFSPNGKYLASCGWDNKILLWDVASQEQVGKPITAEMGAPFSLAFSPDGKVLASANGNSTITLWDLDSREMIGGPLKGHADWVLTLDFNPNGKVLASGSWDRTIILWDLETQRIIDRLAANDIVKSLDFHPDGKVLASGSGSNITFWDMENHQPISEPISWASTMINSLKFSPDGKVLVFGGSDKNIYRMDTVTYQPIGDPLIGHSAEISSIAFSGDGKTLASGSCGKVFMAAGEKPDCINAEVIVWSMGDFQPLKFLLQERTSNRISNLDWNPRGDLLVGNTADQSILLWNTDNIKITSQIIPNLRGANTAFSPDGEFLAFSNCRDLNPFECEQGGEIIFWDLINKKTIGKPFMGHENWITNIAFHPKQTMIASASCRKRNDLGTCIQGEIFLWNIETHEPIGGPLIGHTSDVWDMAFSPDGNLLATGGSDNTIIIWDVASLKPLLPPFLGNTNEIYSIAISPMGDILASAGNDRSIILWDLASFSQFGLPLEGHKHYILSLEFSPNGDILASGGADGNIILWDMAEHQLIGVPLATGAGAVESIVYNPDGLSLASSHENGTVLLWNLDPQFWIEITCQRVGRNFTKPEWNRFFPGEAYRKTCEQWK